MDVVLFRTVSFLVSARIIIILFAINKNTKSNIEGHQPVNRFYQVITQKRGEEPSNIVFWCDQATVNVSVGKITVHFNTAGSPVLTKSSVVLKSEIEVFS